MTLHNKVSYSIHPVFKYFRDQLWISSFCSFFYLLLRQKKVFNMIASINLPITVRKLHEIVVLLYLVKYSCCQLRESSRTVSFSWQTLIRDTVKLKVTDLLRRGKENDIYIYFSQFIIFLVLCLVSKRDKLHKVEKGSIKQKNPILI